MALDPMVASKGMTTALKKAASLIPKVKVIEDVEYEDRGTLTTPNGEESILVLDDVWISAIEDTTVEITEDETYPWVLSTLGAGSDFVTYATTHNLTVTEDEHSQGLGPDSINVPADTSSFANDFATSYDSYASEGIVLGALNIGGVIESIETYLTSLKYPDPSAIDDFAKALSVYWATVAIVPAAPMHGGISVVSCLNDALAHESDFKAAIQASITTKESKPYYFNLIKNIETIAVKLIIWTVIELIPTPSGPVPTPFPEGIT
jgi:hypothetical protein